MRRLTQRPQRKREVAVARGIDRSGVSKERLNGHLEVSPEEVENLTFRCRVGENEGSPAERALDVPTPWEKYG